MASILAPVPTERSADGDAERGGTRRAAAVVVAGYAGLVVAMLLVGLALTHPLAGSVGHWDESVNRWFADHRSGPWNSVTGTATLGVNTGPAIGWTVLATVVLFVARRRREAAMLVIAISLELVVFLSVTFVVARPRPSVPRLNSTPSTSSFPSGHTAAATVLLAGLAIIVTCCTERRVLRIVAVVVAVAGATLIGFARVYRGMHHPTDVVAGALLGAGCLFVAVLAVRTATANADAPADEPELRTSAGTALQPVPQSAA